MAGLQEEDFGQLVNAVKQARGGGNGLRSATAGFDAERDRALAEKQAAFKQKIAEAGLVPGSAVAGAAPELGLPADRPYDATTLTSILATKKTEAEKAAALAASKAEKDAALADKKAHMIPGAQSPTGQDIYPDAFNALKEKQNAAGKASEQKTKTSFYAGMAKNAAPVLDAADSEGYGQGQMTTLDLPVPERFKTGKRKSFETAARQFATAILRPETGAQANEQELEDTKKRFIVQAGDTPEVASQKRASRQVAMELLQKIANGDTNAAAKLDEMIGRANAAAGNPATGSFAAPGAPASTPPPPAAGAKPTVTPEQARAALKRRGHF